MPFVAWPKVDWDIVYTIDAHWSDKYSQKNNQTPSQIVAEKFTFF